MEVGEVGFNHPDRVRSELTRFYLLFWDTWLMGILISMQVRTYVVKEKDREIVKALNRTKVEKYPDLEGFYELTSA